MELFKKCSICGALTSEADQTIKTIGSRITVSCKCNNGHTGHWESCPNTCGMPENSLLAAAATLFTGATFTDIADWAGLLNLRLPQKTTYNNIQASYLIPVIEAAYKKQEDIIKARLICQSRDGEEVHLCGDGRRDSPDHSVKYTTYSFTDDDSNQIVDFDLDQIFVVMLTVIALSNISEIWIVLKTVYVFNKEKPVKMLCLLAKASTSTQTRCTMDVGFQTHPSQLRSVGTLLSFTMLQAKYRSTGLLMFWIDLLLALFIMMCHKTEMWQHHTLQVSSFELSMPSVSHPAAPKVMISTPLKTPLKRPRLELEEEETLTESTFTAQDSDVTFDPAEGETSVTGKRLVVSFFNVQVVYNFVCFNRNNPRLYDLRICIFISEPMQAVLSKTY